MTLEIIPVEDRPDLMEEFIRFPYRLYQHDKAFVAPLLWERRQAYNREKNPFFQHAEAEFFLCFKDNHLAGRISAQMDQHYLQAYPNDPAGFFGSFEAIEDPSVAQALFQAAENWLKSKGITSCFGPCTLSAQEELGLLIDGFDTPSTFLNPHHLPYYRRLIESCGYEKTKELYAWNYDAKSQAKETAERIIQRTKDNPDLVIRPIHTISQI